MNHHFPVVIVACAASAIHATQARAAGGPDFNNDGYADLVIGTPFAGDSSGIVQVAMGSAGGLSPSAPLDLHIGLEGVPGDARPGNEFGMAMAWGDFDNDGFDDLAVGVPNRRIKQEAQAGCVFVLRGSVDGLTDENVQFWSKNSPNVPSPVRTEELFGWSLAAGDFNDDGYSDLAIGTPQQRVTNRSHAGSVVVLYGSTAGLQGVGSQLYTQDALFIPGTAGEGDLFGYALITGDFNGDSADDLAVAAPDDDESIGAIGSITVLLGSPFGLSGVGASIWNRNNIATDVGPANQFGFSLAAGDFNDDNRDDLAFGCPFDQQHRGRVVILPGSSGGINGAQAIALFPDENGGGRHLFGWALTCGDFDADGYADLSAGAPFMGTTDFERIGGVHVIFGGAGGLATGDRELWTELDIDGSGGVEADEWLGMALTGGDFDNNGADDLIMSAPFEDVGGERDSGAVIILPGSTSGFVSGMSQFWTQPLLGRPAVLNEAMGFSLMR